MVEVFVVVSGKGGIGKMMSMFVLGMVFVEEYDVIVIDVDMGMVNLFFYVGLDDVDVMFYDLFIDDYDVVVFDVVYEWFGLFVVFCGMSFVVFEVVDFGCFCDVVVEFVVDMDVLFFDLFVVFGFKSVVFFVVFVDCIVVVFQFIVLFLFDGLKVQEYVYFYGIDMVGVVFNCVCFDENVEIIVEQVGCYFGGQMFVLVFESDVVCVVCCEGKFFFVYVFDDLVVDVFCEVVV